LSKAANRIKSIHRRVHTDRICVGKDVDDNPIFERITTGDSLRTMAQAMANSQETADRAPKDSAAARKWLQNKRRSS
jgi:hypothetical protein